MPKKINRLKHFIFDKFNVKKCESLKLSERGYAFIHMFFIYKLIYHEKVLHIKYERLHTCFEIRKLYLS